VKRPLAERGENLVTTWVKAANKESGSSSERPGGEAIADYAIVQGAADERRRGASPTNGGGRSVVHLLLDSTPLRESESCREYFSYKNYRGIINQSISMFIFFLT
jgi:hypothetical protein